MLDMLIAHQEPPVTSWPQGVSEQVEVRPQTSQVTHMSLQAHICPVCPLSLPKHSPKSELLLAGIRDTKLENTQHAKQCKSVPNLKFVFF